MWWKILKTLTVLHGNSICNKSRMFWEYVQSCCCDFGNKNIHLCGSFKEEFGSANLSQFGKSVVDICWSTSLYCFNFKIPIIQSLWWLALLGDKWNVRGVVLPSKIATCGKSCFCVSWGGSSLFMWMNCWIAWVRTTGLIERKVEVC